MLHTYQIAIKWAPADKYRHWYVCAPDKYKAVFYWLDENPEFDLDMLSSAHHVEVEPCNTDMPAYA